MPTFPVPTFPVPTFKVPDMSCGHCVATIEKALKGADPMAEVRCDLDQRTVAVTSTLAPAAVADLLRDAGYENETLPA